MSLYQKISARLLHPLGALFIYELPLLAGLRFSSPWVIPGQVLMAIVMLRGMKNGFGKEWNRLLDRRVFFSVAIASILAWIVLVPLKYFVLAYTVFDTGVFAGALHSFVETGRYWSSVLQMPALRDHFTPNLLLLSPLFIKGSSFTVLHLLKLSAFVSCAVILLKLSRSILGPNSVFTYALPTLWCLHSFMGRAMDFEFQPTSLSLPFILLAFLFAVENRRVALMSVLIFLLGFKEQMGIVWISIGVFLLLKDHKDRLGQALVVLGAVAGLVIYTQIMPLFEPRITPVHAARFGPLELIPEKIRLIARALLSVGLLPLFAPATLCWILPAFGLALISREAQMIKFMFHYQDVPLTVMFVGAIFGLKAIEQKALPVWVYRPVIQRVLMAACISSLCIMNTWYPSNSIRRHLPGKETITVVNELRDIASKLPPSCTVVALNSLGTYFYEFPDLQMIFGPDQNFKRGEKVFVIAPGVNPWPLESDDLIRFRKRLESSASLEKSSNYRGVEVYFSQNCRV